MKHKQFRAAAKAGSVIKSVAMTAGMWCMLGAAIVPPTCAGENDSANVQSIVLSYEVNGINPKAITRPAGRFVVFIFGSNRENATVLQLAREDGGVVAELRRKKGEARSTLVVDLTPGTYRLSEVSNSRVVCQLTVVAK